jgi:hypothetical protein
MSDILKLIDSALAEGFADEELAEMVCAIQDENRARMERMAKALGDLSGKPRVLLDGEAAWFLGNGKCGTHRYAVMTHTGAMREVILPSSFPKLRRL